MPELPEVETTRRGIAGQVEGQVIRAVIVRNGRLRWPIPADLDEHLLGARVQAVRRRAKYLLFDMGHGYLILHLGMSGSLRVLADNTPAQVHDHFDVVLSNGFLLRLRDPRRFGAVLWSAGPPEQHRLLAHLGPEPLSEHFDAESWLAATRRRAQAVKLALMDQTVVVGVGNIYANEALFRARIDPRRAANRLRHSEVAVLVAEIKAVLTEAIAAGGSSLRDYVGGDGASGYFQLQTWVYGRGGQPCLRCGSELRSLRQAQRATVFCPLCQK